ncbi:hypothetical protein MLD38_022903 [Melastoma candidum]|uniref:Uncharacterized protein n=1 Tax=Melastoma candidum TaxID=119954 RepID=A0ACB9QTZ0_9MYRT|nr:hypothetical protein MLD38_022903 [Melastoma candidum]
MGDSQTTVSVGEWSSLNGIHASEEADFMAEFPGSYFLSNVEAATMSFTWSYLEPTTTVAPADDTGDFYSSNFCYFQSPSHVDCGFCDINHEITTNVNGLSSVNVLGDESSLHEEGPELKGGFDVPEQERDDGGDKYGDKTVGKGRKRTHSMGNSTKTKRNVKSKKKQNVGLPSSPDEIDVNGGVNYHDSGVRYQEDDSAASKDQHAGSTSSSKDPTTDVPIKGKARARAGRGSSTDPQSLYARKRRERINERLRVLQSLVPNGTKVDISTMLEEAVHYVKFLQLQIKLLSSDDLWIYAPIAYNGMDIGLDATALLRARNSESRPGPSGSVV